MPILRVKNLVKYYGNGSIAVKALDGVSFDVEQGEFVAVMGASGSGKSTLLNVISTIEPPSSGNVVIDEAATHDMKPSALAAFRRDKLGFIFQDYNLLDTLTVAENIVLPLNLRKNNVEDSRRKLESVASVLGVGDILSKFPYELSGGQRQRVACARAVIGDPAVVLADEPTGALDSRNSHTLMEQFLVMNSSLGATVLMVTHDAQMAAYASRILVLADGKILTELYRGNRDRREFLREILTVTAGGADDDI